VTVDTGIRLLQSKDPFSLEGAIQTPVTPGKANLHLQWRDHAMTIPVTYVAVPVGDLSRFACCSALSGCRERLDAAT